MRFSLQLLKGVTIASGGVLPRIHPELLAKKRGTKGKSETILSPPPEKRGRKATSGKKGGKKSKAAKPRTSKKVSRAAPVSQGLSEQEASRTIEDEGVATSPKNRGLHHAVLGENAKRALQASGRVHHGFQSVGGPHVPRSPPSPR